MREELDENQYPNTCPVCGEKINPILISSKEIKEWAGSKTYEAVFLCNNKKCNRHFIALYISHSHGQYISYEGVGIMKYVESINLFNKEIEELSPKFTRIYKQALQCRENNLDEITGIGYRKAFEFLLKDFLCLIEKESEKNITEIKEHSSLIYLINKYVKDNELKDIAEKCGWLGNDEAHYVRKHEEYDIEDLEQILNITLHYIQIQLGYKKYSKIKKK